jgi:hypothetical protein
MEYIFYFILILYFTYNRISSIKILKIYLKENKKTNFSTFHQFLVPKLYAGLLFRLTCSKLDFLMHKQQVSSPHTEFNITLMFEILKKRGGGVLNRKSTRDSNG